MSLDASQKSANGLETPQQDPPASSATDTTATNATNKNESSDGPSILKKATNAVKDTINGTADTKTVTAGQPLEAAKPKEPAEPTKPVQSEEPLPKEDSGIAGTGAEVQNNGTSTDDEAKSAGKMDVESPTKKLPLNDPTTIGDVSAKDSEGQVVDHVKAKELASVQENAKHGHDDDQAVDEEQRPAKKQKTAPAKESNGGETSKIPKRGASQKKKEPKKATTEDGQPRRSSRLAT